MYTKGIKKATWWSLRRWTRTPRIVGACAHRIL